MNVPSPDTSSLGNGNSDARTTKRKRRTFVGVTVLLLGIVGAATCLVGVRTMGDQSSVGPMGSTELIVGGIIASLGLAGLGAALLNGDEKPTRPLDR